MKRLLILFFIVSFLYVVPCESSDNTEILVYWLNSVADGVHDLNQPILPFSSKMKEIEYMKSFPQPKSASKENFLSFLRVTEPVEECWSRAFGNANAVDRGFYFDSKTMPKDVIAKILSRRTPIINTFEFDKTRYSGVNPKYVCQASAGGSWDYLGLFQFRLVLILIVSDDFRFQSEAGDLLSYISTPVSPDVDIWATRDQEAKACYTGSVLGSLPKLLESYIQYCNKSKKK